MYIRIIDFYFITKDNFAVGTFFVNFTWFLVHRESYLPTLIPFYWDNVSGFNVLKYSSTSICFNFVFLWNNKWTNTSTCYINVKLYFNLSVSWNKVGGLGFRSFDPFNLDPDQTSPTRNFNIFWYKIFRVKLICYIYSQERSFWCQNILCCLLYW